MIVQSLIVTVLPIPASQLGNHDSISHRTGRLRNPDATKMFL